MPRKKKPTFREKYLVHDACWVARWAWSMWALYATAALTAGAVALPLLAPAIPNEWMAVYAAVVFLVVLSAIIARFFAQKRYGGDLNAG